jgi:hypothetical protein
MKILYGLTGAPEQIADAIAYASTAPRNIDRATSPG